MVALNMKNHERKRRILLSRYTKDGVPVNYNVSFIRQMIEKKLPALSTKPYKLRHSTLESITYKVKTPPKLRDTAMYSDSELSSMLHSMQSIQLFVNAIPGVFPAPTKEFYAGMVLTYFTYFSLATVAILLFHSDMNDPAETDSFTMVSFYTFNPIADAAQFAQDLEKLWHPFLAVGRIYVAKEGVNAQMAIPTNVIRNFKAATLSLQEFSNLKLNTDHRVSLEEFEAARPFKALHIRVREQIVADGFHFDPSTENLRLDWSKSGQEMAPMEWHRQLDDAQAIVLDCRNSYESDVGVFQHAIPLNTTFFRESWAALDSLLKDTPKDAKLMTYCTGGIRCVKINAYLEQKLGFRNVHRLQGGIISYARELELQARHAEGTEDVEVVTLLPAAKDQRNVVESKFKGVNYVFDERMSSRITDDVLSYCDTCGASCDSYGNCQNSPCNVRSLPLFE